MDNKKLFFLSGKTYSGYAYKGTGLIVINIGAITDRLSFIAMHEFGHAFCGLDDEYLYGESKYGILYKPLTNCVHLPREDYQYNKILYGNLNNVGCSYKSLFASPKALSENPSLYYYRPSYNSIMSSYRGLVEFNVVSCGYCLAAIKGGDPKSYWPECMKLDTIR